MSYFNPEETKKCLEKASNLISNMGDEITITQKYDQSGEKVPSFFASFANGHTISVSCRYNNNEQLVYDILSELYSRDGYKIFHSYEEALAEINRIKNL